MNIEIKESNGGYFAILSCSLGLRGLLKLQKLSVAKGGTLVLTHVNDEIQKILTLTGFIKLFNFR